MVKNSLIYVLGTLVLCLFQSCNENNINKINSTNNQSDKMLSKDIDTVLDKRNNENTPEVFSLFLKKFNSDCIFQKERVQFPLQVISLMEYETNDYDTSFLAKAEYECMEFTEPKSNIMDGHVNLKFNNQKDIVIITVGLEDTGVHIDYKFKLVSKRWILIRITDGST